MNNIADRKILEKAKSFDLEALGLIYDQFSPGIYRYAIRLLGDPTMAEECVSETFSRFLSVLRLGKGPDNFLKAYLYRIAHNWITDTYRRQPSIFTSLDETLHDPQHEDIEIKTSHNLEKQAIRLALQGLSPEQRQVIVLKFMEDWSNEEIARAINKPVGAVKALQHRGIGTLRRLLGTEKE